MSMTIAEKLIQDAENWQSVAASKEAIKASIAGKGVSVPVGTKLEDTPTLIDAIETGGVGPAITHNVKFVDYDGTVISEQNVEEGQAAIDPGFPVVPYTTALGWLDDFSNITSDTLIFLSRQSSDGLTRAFISLRSDLTGLTVYINIELSAAGTLIIDYGDGYVLSLPSGSAVNYTTVPGHTYASDGDYMITISGTAKFRTVDAISGIPNPTTKGAFIGTKYSSNSISEFALRKIIFGNNVSQLQSLKYHRFLSSILIPPVVPTSDYFAYSSSIFTYNYSIQCLVIPAIPSTMTTGLMSKDQTGFESVKYLRYQSINGGDYYANNNYYTPEGPSVANSSFRAKIDLSTITYTPQYICSGFNFNGSELYISSTGVGNTSFYQCYNVKKIVIGSAVRKIGGASFNGVKDCEFVFENINNLTHIYSSAFTNSSVSGIIDIPASCQCVIGAFSNTDVSSLRIRNVIDGKYGQDNGLYEMPNLEYLDLDSTSTTISYTAEMTSFAPKLKGVIFRLLTPPTISTSTFKMSRMDNIYLDVYVPDVTWDYYIVATNWVDLYNAGKLHKISEYAY